MAGTNLYDRAANLATARELVNRQCGTITQLSSIYETAPWGNPDQPNYLNQAVEINTSLNARQTIRCLLKLEKLMGRVREEKYGARIIDLDLLFFNDEIHQYHFLQLPHPEIQNRRFVLIPLAEIAPNFLHPVFKQTIDSLLDVCPDQLEVKKWEA